MGWRNRFGRRNGLRCDGGDGRFGGCGFGWLGATGVQPGALAPAPRGFRPRRQSQRARSAVVSARSARPALGTSARWARRAVPRQPRARQWARQVGAARDLGTPSRPEDRWRARQEVPAPQGLGRRLSGSVTARLRRPAPAGRWFAAARPTIDQPASRRCQARRARHRAWRRFRGRRTATRTFRRSGPRPLRVRRGRRAPR